MRKSLHPNLDNECLSEDSDFEEESDLRVPKGAINWSPHPDNGFVVSECNMDSKVTASVLKIILFRRLYCLI